MFLEAGVLHTKLARGTPEERAWVLQYLSFKTSGDLFTGGAPQRLYNVISDTFPTGLLPLVKAAAEEEKFKVDVVDKRLTPATFDASADIAWLRWYQREALDKVVEKQRGILWLPTGAGKTEIAVALTRALPCNWLLLTHRTGLAAQAAARYHLRTGLQAGYIGAGIWNADWKKHRFICASFSTLAKKLKNGDPYALALLGAVDGLQVDECHVLPAGSFWQGAVGPPGAYGRGGVGGTPLARGDQRSMLALAAIGPVLYRLKPEVLIQEGVLARANIKMVEVKLNVSGARGAYATVYENAVARGLERNRVLVAEAKRAEKPAFLFVQHKEHGHLLVELLKSAGVKAAFVWGDLAQDERLKLIRKLESGRLEVIVCSVVLQEGVDVPTLRTVLVGSGGKSVIAALQRIGRGMRVSAGKNEFHVVDIADKGCGCQLASYRLKDGFSMDKLHPGCAWLERHTHARMAAYAKEGHSVRREKALP